ncbi:amidohydrolase [Dyella sp. ASV21]|uniref:amidohydrolase n=1 Tax=Dyella sp. ASV21 TaxID=2795114 RepID=UPI0018EB558F|nr:amidohydrolase [Dyella sp. ASV21]
MSNQATLYNAIDQAVEAHRTVIEKAAMDIWNLSELPMKESQSSATLLNLLEQNGFTITSRAAAGIPTAFVAEYGSGSPKVGLLLEYDALPNLGNEAVTEKKPRADGNVNGHGCGHNLIGASSLGAALALKQVMAAQKLPGTLRVYGCAAEETEGAKVYMAREKMFADLDACFHTHPFNTGMVASIRTTATDQMRVEFRGVTAHAGNTPWLGRSAVHAAELFAHGINAMREHLEPTARVHYVYEMAGVAPNVVPDCAQIWLYSRDCDREHVNKTSQWIRQIAEGAAMATQTKANVELYFGLYDLMPNSPLGECVHAHLQRVGIPDWTAQEQQFARDLQTAFGVEPAGLSAQVQPIPPEPRMGGFTDVGDVSWQTPTSGVTMVTLPLGISLHTLVATAVHGMSIGLRSCVNTSRILAAAALDVLTDASLREAARADFLRRTEGKPFQSALPPDRKQPYSMPDFLIANDGGREMTG